MSRRGRLRAAALVAVWAFGVGCGLWGVDCVVALHSSSVGQSSVVWLLNKHMAICAGGGTGAVSVLLHKVCWRRAVVIGRTHGQW